MVGGCPAVMAQWQNTGSSSQWFPWFDMQMCILSSYAESKITNYKPCHAVHAAKLKHGICDINRFFSTCLSICLVNQNLIGKKHSSCKMFAVGACLQTPSIYSSLKWPYACNLRSTTSQYEHVPTIKILLAKNFTGIFGHKWPQKRFLSV